ncbi:lipopolysaccharide biosynthesis protein [Gillisia hiemivivida]|uniref:Lipopolysaccharide biosynthesis protein n=1 Tax=Gillisia hiemivivida TaxID=291190 RepID=A0A5C6ZXQ5_9FLAO|nr:lipopolysaccharide biosynthesis protein [Gillisia hiemivivida]TXD95737.1 lipopolysaccharide biosynthesis protein [Gillisia hiemivivida]
MDDHFKRNILTNFFWSFVGRGGYLVVGLIANIVLARLLSPYEFGQVGIIMFFIVIAKVLTESGLSGALIRKQEAKKEDYSTVFVFNLAVSFVLMMLLMSFSGNIANFYEDPQLKNILIVSSTILLINAFQITQTAKLIKNLNFKRKAVYEFLSILFASIIGIFMAISNAGVWSIVVMQIATSFILTLLLWIFEGPFLRFIFDVESFKSLYKFGVNTTLASILNTAFDNIYQLVLGKYFAITQTGLFFQAKRLQEVPVGVIQSTALGVVFSSLSKLQNDKPQFKATYDLITKMFTIAVGLICLLIFFYAENIILVLYGKDWIGATFYVQVLIVASFFFLQETFNRIIFKVFDRTEKILHLEIIKKIIQLITVVIGVYLLSIKFLLFGFLGTSVISYFINYYYSRKIYDSFSWYELALIIKVFTVSGLTVLGSLAVEKFTIFNGYYSFWILPIIILFYFFLLKTVGVSNVLTEAKKVIRIYKGR